MNFDKLICDELFKIISYSSKNIGHKCYVIGGYVRDFIIGKSKKIYKDIDIVSTGEGILLAKEFAKNVNINPNKIKIFKNFGTAMLRYNKIDIEFVGARKESYTYNSRNPSIKNGTIKDDQNRRDFTINTLAISLNSEDYGSLLDPFNGLEDLKKKIIRTPLNPEKTYSDDPLRMLRAIRLSNQLEFNIEESSLASIKNNKKRILIVSMERIMDEFQKILISKKPSYGIILMYKTGILDIILPELTALKGIEEKEGNTHKDNFYHTLEVLDNISCKTNCINLRWAALLHDIGKSKTKKYIPNIGWTFYSHEFIGSKMITSIFRRLKLPMGNSMNYIKKIIKYSSRPISLIQEKVTDSAIRRLVFDAGNDIKDLITLCKADITTKNIYKKIQYKNNFNKVIDKINNLKDRDRIKNWKSPVSGYDIMNFFDVKPCKEIGIIKNLLKDAILDGKVINEYFSAFNFVIKKGKELGLMNKQT